MLVNNTYPQILTAVDPFIILFSGGRLPTENLLAYYKMVDGAVVDTIGESSRSHKLPSYGLFATGDYLTGQIANDVTVVSSNGGGTVALSSGRLDYTSGEKLWSFELSNGSTYEYPTYVNATSAIWRDTSGNGRHLELANDTAVDADTHCVSEFSLDGSDTLEQSGWSYHENVITQLLYYETDSEFSGPDDEGYITATKLNTSSGKVSFAGYVTDSAESTTYSSRVALLAIDGSTNNSCDVNFNIGSNHSASKVSGPGTVAVIDYGTPAKFVRITDLSLTDPTIVDISSDGFTVGADAVQIQIYPSGLTAPVTGDGCKIKRLQVCVGSTVNEYTSVFKTPLSTYEVSTQSEPVSTNMKKLVCFGDSLTNIYPDIIRGIFPETLVVKRNHGGYRSDQLDALFDSEVVTESPDHCMIMCGTNDAGQSYTFEHIQTYILSMVSKAQTAGIGVTLTTIPPRGEGATTYTEAMKAEALAFNAWVVPYGAANSIEVADLYAWMLDSATGYLNEEYNDDDVHFNELGADRQAHLFARHMPCTLGTADTSQSPIQHSGGNKYSPEIISGSFDDYDTAVFQFPQVLDILRAQSVANGPELWVPTIIAGTGFTDNGDGSYTGIDVNNGSSVSTATNRVFNTKTYIIKYKATGYQGGTWRLLFTGGVVGSAVRSADGEFTEELTADRDGKIYLWSLGSLSVTFSDITVREKGVNPELFYDNLLDPVQRTGLEWDAIEGYGLWYAGPKYKAIYSTSQYDIESEIMKKLGIN